jgi:hypothetical protein
MNDTEETRATGGVLGHGTSLGGRLLSRAVLSTLFLLSSFPLGLLWFVVLAALLLVGLPLTIVWVGLPALVLAMLVCVYGVRVERWRLRALLDTRLPAPYRPLPRGPVLARVWARAADPALWRGLMYLLLLLPIGLVELVVVLLLIFSTVLVSYPPGSGHSPTAWP